MKYKKILLLRPENKIGDTVCWSFFPRELKKIYPKSKLSVVTAAPLELLKLNPHIDNLMSLPFDRTFKNFIKLLKILLYLNKQKYDLIIIPDLTKKGRFFVKLINAKQVILAHKPLKEHITHGLSSALEILGAKTVDTTYELFISSDDEKYAQKFMDKNNLLNNKFIIINPFACEKYRTLGIEKIKNIIKLLQDNLLDYKFIILDYKKQYISLNKICIFYTSNNIMQTATIIKHSNYVLTVDTGIAHIADVFHKKMTVLFSLQPFHNQTEKNNNLIRWTPLTIGTRILHTDGTVDDISEYKIIKEVLEHIMEKE